MHTGVMRHGASLAEITVLALAGLESILDVRQPDAVLVQGGATSALAGGGLVSGIPAVSGVPGAPASAYPPAP
jgi:UDP-N-acetylglucosamine 2-epimerase